MDIFKVGKSYSLTSVSVLEDNRPIKISKRDNNKVWLNGNDKSYQVKTMYNYSCEYIKFGDSDMAATLNASDEIIGKEMK